MILIQYLLRRVDRSLVAEPVYDLPVDGQRKIGCREDVGDVVGDDVIHVHCDTGERRGDGERTGARRVRRVVPCSFEHLAQVDVLRERAP